jgi:hypothetical protein
VTISLNATFRDVVVLREQKKTQKAATNKIRKKSKRILFIAMCSERFFLKHRETSVVDQKLARSRASTVTDLARELHRALLVQKSIDFGDLRCQSVDCRDCDAFLPAVAEFCELQQSLGKKAAKFTHVRWACVHQRDLIDAGVKVGA